MSDEGTRPADGIEVHSLAGNEKPVKSICLIQLVPPQFPRRVADSRSPWSGRYNPGTKMDIVIGEGVEIDPGAARQIDAKAGEDEVVERGAADDPRC